MYNPKYNKSDQEYKKKKYDQINLKLPKGYNQELKAVAAYYGMSSAEFVRSAIAEYAARRGYPATDLLRQYEL